MKQLCFCLLLSFSIPAFAQIGAKSSKRKTVSYLNKKLLEIKGAYRSIEADDKSRNIKYFYWGTHYVKLSGDTASIRSFRSTYREQLYSNVAFQNGEGYLYTYPCDYHTQSFESTFNPAHIKSIEKGSNFVEGEPIGLIKINLVSETGNLLRIDNETRKGDTSTNECHDFGETDREEATDTEVYLPYLQSNPKNFNRIKKALEHLRDLYKAEETRVGK